MGSAGVNQNAFQARASVAPGRPRNEAGSVDVAWELPQGLVLVALRIAKLPAVADPLHRWKQVGLLGQPDRRRTVLAADVLQRTIGARACGSSSSASAMCSVSMK